MMRFLQKRQISGRNTNASIVVIGKNKQWRFWPVLLWTLLASVLLWGYVKLENPATAPFQTVNIGGNYQHINTRDLQKIIIPYAAMGFFAIDIDSLKNRLLQVPWVANVSISRIWPHTLDINIVEQEPIAEWNNHSLINHTGMVFSPAKNTFPLRLPYFYGPIGQQDKVLNYFRRMQILLKPLHLQIVTIELTARQAWRIKLSNSITVVLGREEVLPRLQRLVIVYPKIIGMNSQDVNYIDMRYINGIAVSWKTSAAQVTT